MVEETGEGGGSCEVKEVISSSFEYELLYIGERASQVVLVVKNLPALGWEDPLEKEVAPHSSTLAWKIPWTEEPHRLQSMGSQRVGYV